MKSAMSEGEGDLMRDEAKSEAVRLCVRKGVSLVPGRDPDAVLAQFEGR
jgi:hypothetical protein